MSELNERYLWLGAGLAIMVFLVVTTPGWQTVLGIENLSLSINIKEYVPVIALFTFIFGIIGVILLTEKEGGGED